jgi:hypothetical protein
VKTSIRIARVLDSASDQVLASGEGVEAAIELGIRAVPRNQAPTKAAVIDHLCMWWNGVGQMKSKNYWTWDRIRDYFDNAPNRASLLNQCADFWRGGN